MNIDFHYGVIYVVARFAGMGTADAQTVAHACQYVDDATTDGPLQFREQQSFDRFASAHAMMDYRNTRQAKDERVWAPFHFLPAGEGDSVEEKLVCRPDSKPGRELVRHILRAHIAQGAENDLHRLGVCLHTYIDTWAHQGFSGIISDWNHVTELKGEFHPTSAHWLDEVAQCVENFGDQVKSDGVNLLSKVGHGAALHYPDLPWADWRYVNGLGREIIRSNLGDFVTAADMACRVIRAFIAQRDDFDGFPGLNDAQRSALMQFLGKNRNQDEKARLAALSQVMARDGLAGLREALPDYVAKGPGSWKFLATGIESEDDGIFSAEDRPKWSDRFENSDYRKVHDAIKQHRHYVTEELLLTYGVRIA